MSLKIPGQHLNNIVSQIKDQWPNEICGYLSGVGDIVLGVFPVPNKSAIPASSFVMEPQSQLNALVSVQNSKQEILAVYHTHPVSARQDLSERDLAGQIGDQRLQIVIVPNNRREIESLRAFRIDVGSPIEVPVIIEPNRTTHLSNSL